MVPGSFVIYPPRALQAPIASGLPQGFSSHALSLRVLGFYFPTSSAPITRSLGFYYPSSLRLLLLLIALLLCISSFKIPGAIFSKWHFHIGHLAGDL